MAGHGRTHPYFALPAPWLIAHRGGAALAPENTLVAFDNAASLGADAIETDVHLSRDGHVMVFHDDDTARLCGVPGAIEERTRAELERLDAAWSFTMDEGATFPLRGKGVHIPTLADVLARYPGMRFNVDAKSRNPALALALAEVLRSAGTADRVCVGSEYGEPARVLRHHLPEWAHFLPKWPAVGHVARALLPFVPGRWCVEGYDLAALSKVVGWRPWLLQRVLTHFGDRGMPVQLWTVNDEPEMVRLLEAGVHGVMTDHPDRLKDAMRR